MFADFYRGKRVLLTGHTGFKGGWLSLWLHELGAEVHGLSLPAAAGPSLHELISPGCFASQTTCDIRDFGSLKSAVEKTQPEVVFHLAAQALVRRSYEDPLETFVTNAIGTAHLLEAIRTSRINCVTIVATSDKCYENREWEFAYRESDPMGGHDVYSMSKGASELVVQSWKRSFFDNDSGLGPLVTVRAGNVIGGGDYAEDRIVPDCIRALTASRPIPIRNPVAVRPWQHVLECLSGYLCVGARLGREGKQSPTCTPFNFGPDPSAQQPVRRLVEEILAHWPGEWTDSSEPGAVHESKLLALAIDTALVLLGWRPVWTFEEAVRATIEWYRQRHAEPGRDGEMEAYSRGQIRDYVAAAAGRGLPWVE